jgi:hypothetical protein
LAYSIGGGDCHWYSDVLVEMLISQGLQFLSLELSILTSNALHIVGIRLALVRVPYVVQLPWFGQELM